MFLLVTVRAFAQSAPASPDGPWHSADEQQIKNTWKPSLISRFSIEQDRIYTLSELVDLAEEHNPETRVAWETARAQMAALGVARSELYPTIAAIALSQIGRF
jgi:outer membrane protein TolC